MRPIYLVMLDKYRPALILTREVARPVLTRVSVAPITSRIRGLSTELRVGPANGLDHESVVSLDNIHTVHTADLGALVGWLLPAQERQLTEAIQAAFDLTEMH